MKIHTPFLPTWKWHLKVWLVCLLLCVAAYWLLTAIEPWLPAAYRHHSAVAETTPWLQR